MIKILEEGFRPSLKFTIDSELSLNDMYDKIWYMLKKDAVITDFNKKDNTHEFLIDWKKAISLDEYAKMKTKLKKL